MKEGDNAERPQLANTDQKRGQDTGDDSAHVPAKEAKGQWQGVRTVTRGHGALHGAQEQRVTRGRVEEGARGSKTDQYEG